MVAPAKYKEAAELGAADYDLGNSPRSAEIEFATQDRALDKPASTKWATEF